MARRDSAPRRYADAAFEIALRDGTVDTWRKELEAAAATSTAGEIRAITARLEELTGGKIALETVVEPSLLGGVVVRVGDRLLDGSVRGRLERLRNQLASGAL